MIILSKSKPTRRLLIQINLALNNARGSGSKSLRRMEKNLAIDDAQIVRARNIIKQPAVRLEPIEFRMEWSAASWEQSFGRTERL